MKTFVSSMFVDDGPAALLIEGLRRAGLAVEHSPIPTRTNNMTRWYSTGAAEVLQHCDIFVVVFDDCWECSTWMEIEFGWARALGRLRLCCWNPGGVEFRLRRTSRYLGDQLPRELDAAIDSLIHSGR